MKTVTMALAALSAASTLGLAATSRTRFNDYTGPGLNKLTADGIDDEPGASDKTAVVDTNVVGTGANIEQLQQAQANTAAPQADAIKIAEPETAGEAKPAETKMDDPAAGERQLG